MYQAGTGNNVPYEYLNHGILDITLSKWIILYGE